MDRLILKYEYDRDFFDPSKTRDDFGRLSVVAETDRFVGKGGFWVQWQDVKELGEALAACPTPSDQPVVVQWGFDMQQGDDLILRLAFSAVDRRGSLAVEFEIADDYEPRHRVRGRITTTYSNLAAFSHDIARLMSREAEEAVLLGR